MNPKGLLMERKKLLKFEEVYDRVQEQQQLNYKDRVVNLENIRVLPDGNQKKPSVVLEIPRMGRLTMTNWSKRQLGSLLGVKFDKWFDPEVIKAEEIQEEIQRRFARTHESRKIRARRFQPGAPGEKYAEGYIRAVLSPTYPPIDDIKIFDRLGRGFRSQLDGIDFIQDHLGSDFYNDRASHYTAVGEPVNLGPLDRKHPDRRVRDSYDLAEKVGALPDDDWVYQGFHFRNSEVGYTAVTIDGSIFRLVCLNGMITSVSGGRLLYRVHRALSDHDIDGLLDGAFRKMPALWEQNRKQMIALQGSVVDEPEEEIKRFLSAHRATKAFQEAALEAYEVEPLSSRFGIMQALARAAREEHDMDRRVELEELAGQYMAKAA